jgi:type II secretory pathway pseudopilin PulG
MNIKNQDSLYLVKNNSSGFTLIELLMVILLLFFISYTIFTTLRSMVTTKEQIDFQTEIFQGNRAILGQLERDFQRVFFIRATDLTWQPIKKKSQKDPNDESSSPDEPLEPEDTDANSSNNDNSTASNDIAPAPVSLFQGNKDTVFFSTATHQRLYQNAPENEQHFVTYQIVDNNFVRAESYHAVHASDRDDTSKYKTFTLIENVKKFQLEYYDSKTLKWLDKWDSQNPEQLDRVPAAVQVTIEYLPPTPPNSRFTPKLQTLQTSFRLIEDSFRNVVKKTSTETDTSKAISPEDIEDNPEESQ